MEQRNLLIAIVLSVGILIGFQFFFQRLHPPPVPHVRSTEATAPGTPSATPTTPTGAPATHAPGAATAKASETVAQAIAGKPRVDIETPSLRGSISLIGAIR